jgi:hypothetical protein
MGRLKGERIKENICGEVSTWTQSIFFRSGMSSKQGHISSQTIKKWQVLLKYFLVLQVYKRKSLYGICRGGLTEAMVAIKLMYEVC